MRPYRHCNIAETKDHVGHIFWGGLCGIMYYNGALNAKSLKLPFYQGV